MGFGGGGGVSVLENGRKSQKMKSINCPGFVWKNYGMYVQRCRKHCGKRRNCSLRAIFSFLTVFSKDFYCKHVKRRTCLGKGQYIVLNLYALSMYYTIVTFNDPEKGVWKHPGKRRKCWYPTFSPFPTMFSNFLVKKRKINVWLTFICLLQTLWI